MSAERIRRIMEERVPVPAVDYCYRLWEEAPFDLKITRTRQTKVGDFTARRNMSRPRITLNHELNPYLFLITYIHEVAHLRVYLRYGNRVDPHGDEWKTQFRLLLEPVMHPDVFPDDIMLELLPHMENPKASSFADAALTRVLRQYDADADQYATLADIPEGSVFRFQGKYFKKGKLRRTRVLCHELKSRRQYLVPADVLVTGVQLALL